MAKQIFKGDPYWQFDGSAFLKEPRDIRLVAIHFHPQAHHFKELVSGMWLLALAQILLKPQNFSPSFSSAMISFLCLAALLLTAVVASPVTHITSVANLTTSTGTTVRIGDTSGFQFILDPGYPLAQEFTPWVLVPQDNNTFTIQNAHFPNMFISYASFGLSATTPIHSQLVLRGNANAAVFSLQTLSGGLTVNIVIPAINKVLSSWTTTLADATTPRHTCSIPFANASCFENVKYWQPWSRNIQGADRQALMARGIQGLITPGAHLITFGTPGRLGIMVSVGLDLHFFWFGAGYMRIRMVLINVILIWYGGPGGNSTPWWFKTKKDEGSPMPASRIIDTRPPSSFYSHVLSSTSPSRRSIAQSASRRKLGAHRLLLAYIPVNSSLLSHLKVLSTLFTSQISWPSHLFRVNYSSSRVRRLRASHLQLLRLLWASRPPDPGLPQFFCLQRHPITMRKSLTSLLYCNARAQPAPTAIYPLSAQSFVTRYPLWHRRVIHPYLIRCGRIDPEFPGEREGGLTSLEPQNEGDNCARHHAMSSRTVALGVRRVKVDALRENYAANLDMAGRRERPSGTAREQWTSVPSTEVSFFGFCGFPGEQKSDMASSGCGQDALIHRTLSPSPTRAVELVSSHSLRPQMFDSKSAHCEFSLLVRGQFSAGPHEFAKAHLGRAIQRFHPTALRSSNVVAFVPR
ncbi:hypothetical protein B0H10DRAFT_2201431 [Mycena sp. CBHHK59/15]|nr:hypothetical protein B0H10DRAFT_2201431 [Mycena sp. CBHHK59/15]